MKRVVLAVVFGVGLFGTADASNVVGNCSVDGIQKELQIDVTNNFNYTMVCSVHCSMTEFNTPQGHGCVITAPAGQTRSCTRQVTEGTTVVSAPTLLRCSTENLHPH